MRRDAVGWVGRLLAVLSERPDFTTSRPLLPVVAAHPAQPPPDAGIDDSNLRLLLGEVDCWTWHTMQQQNCRKKKPTAPPLACRQDLLSMAGPRCRCADHLRPANR